MESRLLLVSLRVVALLISTVSQSVCVHVFVYVFCFRCGRRRCKRVWVVRESRREQFLRPQTPTTLNPKLPEPQNPKPLNLKP